MTTVVIVSKEGGCVAISQNQQCLFLTAIALARVVFYLVATKYKLHVYVMMYCAANGVQ